jgi:hypothetical protein
MKTRIQIAEVREAGRETEKIDFVNWLAVQLNNLGNG